jgi:ABC-2 type transport system permease protein
MAGMLGELYHQIDKLTKKQDDFTDMVYNVVQWSPYGAVKNILFTGMEPTHWDANTSTALLLTLVYTIVFTTLGIKWFRWNTK